ncbi:MAG: hypothetical protein CL867_00665 [Cytophagaceae bacterium]|nr:hypothetical protein [Cytophagaceae bacterium]
MICLRQIILVLFCLSGYIGQGQDFYLLDTAYPVHDLDEQLLILEDSLALLTPKEIIDKPKAAFSKRAAFGRHLNPLHTYWGRLDLKATAAVNQWILDLDDPFKDNILWIRSNGKVDVYLFKDSKLYAHKKTGVAYPKQERDLNSHWVLNRVGLDLEPNQRYTLVIKVTANAFGFPPYFNVNIRNPKFSDSHPAFPYGSLLHIFMLGVTFIIFLYHLLQYLYARQAVFLWFSLWLLFCFITQTLASGIAGDTYLSGNPQWRYPLWLIIANGMLFTFWLFGRSFTNSKEKFPLLDKFMLALPTLMFINTAVQLSLYAFAKSDNPFLRPPGHFEVILIYAIAGFVLAVILAFKKDPFARYFGIGAILATVGMGVGAMWSMQWFQPPFDPYTYGMLAQIIAYSFGIGYRQQQIAKAAATRKLAAERQQLELDRIRDLDEIKTKFFTNLSHEFRTPLSLIIDPLEAAVKKNSSDQIIDVSRKTLEMVRNNAFKMKELVDQLLELSRLENSKVVLHLRKADITSFIKAVSARFENFAHQKKIQLVVAINTDQTLAYFDADKLDKIISNLLSNAFKFTPERGQVLIDICIHHGDLLLTIADNGPGIAPEALSHIFERFYRVEGSQTPGSGVGLALVKELVNLQNGSIEVESHKGKGTKMIVKLPITLSRLPEHVLHETAPFVQQQEEDEQKAPSHQVIAQDNGELQLPKLLLIEDHDDMRNYIKELFESEYEVIAARDGLQGLHLAYESIPDVIVSDVMMPKKSGIKLCHELKNDPRTSHIPIVLLTAKVTQNYKLEGLHTGADSYLTKPFDSEELILQVRNLVQSRKQLWDYFSNLNGTKLPDIALPQLENQFLQKVFTTITASLEDESFSVERLSAHIGFSRSQLHRKVKALTNQSPSELISVMRLQKAHELLSQNQLSVSEVAYSVGYSNLSYFTKTFKERFGILPSKVSGKVKG